MNTSILISCVICTYNRERFLHSSIESMVKQTLNKDKFEVVIVNNNSTDNTNEICLELIDKYSNKINFNYVIEENQGLSYARNRGIKEAKGDLICYIDDDAIANHDFLENIVSFFEKDKSIGGVGGKIIPLYVDGKPNWMNKFMEGLVSKVDYGNKIFEFNGKRFPIGCNMTYRKELLNKIGQFDVDLGRKGNSGVASEEKDVFFKIFNLNIKIYYLPRAKVQHIIEKERLNYAYIQKISAGIGKGERMRIAKKGRTFEIRKTFELYFKLLASFIIGFFYLITFQFPKTKAVILFRVDVLKGWFGKL